MTIAVEKVLYTAHATADGGRDGKVATDDGKLDVVVVPPAEMGPRGAIPRIFSRSRSNAGPSTSSSPPSSRAAASIAANASPVSGRPRPR